MVYIIKKPIYMILGFKEFLVDKEFGTEMICMYNIKGLYETYESETYEPNIVIWQK
jgi:hypothetical protein